MLGTGECIYLWRLERGMGQAELAHQSGIPQPNLSNIEREKTDLTLSTLRKLAQALDVPAGDLVEGKTPGTDLAALSSSRSSLEKIASAVFDETIPLNPSQKKVVSRLRLLWPQKKRASISQKELDRAWMSLRTHFPAGTLRALFERIQDQEQRLEKLK